MFALVLLLTSTAASSALLHASDSLCARALGAAPDLSCAEAGHGVALAATPEEAQRLAGYARAGEARFTAQFGRDIAPYVVISTPPVPQRAALTAAGFTHVLPWPAPRAFDEAAQRARRGGGEKDEAGAREERRTDERTAPSDRGVAAGHAKAG